MPATLTRRHMEPLEQAGSRYAELMRLAAYAGMELAGELAQETGIAAVGIARSSHYGAAGAYALAGAEAGLIALSMTNADAIWPSTAALNAFTARTRLQLQPLCRARSRGSLIWPPL